MAAKYALVTGGNRGIGLDVSRKLVEKGKPVILTARDPVAGAAAVDQLNALAAAPAVFLPLDAADPASIQALVGAVAARYDKQIDLLVNNAGVLFHNTWSADAWGTTLGTNFRGALDITLGLAPHLAPGALVTMVSSGLGQYSNISDDLAGPIRAATSLQQLRDIAATFPPASGMASAPPGNGGFAPTYCVSKCLLNRAVQLLAGGAPELGGEEVAVVSVCPGWCRTRMGTDAATRSSEQGADSTLWPYYNWDKKLDGGFTRDGEPVEW